MKTKLLCLSILLSIALSLKGQTGDWSKALAQARQLAEAGSHREAEVAYNNLLQQDPNNLDALIGAGYNYSWNKQFDQARIKFETALSLDANATEALVGMAYNYAWAGNYAVARHTFQRLQSAQPTNIDAEKGLGYVSLWEGDGDEAVHYFRQLALHFPSEIEYRIALAQAYLIKHEVKNARLALQSALQLDASNRIANTLLNSTYGVAAPLEFDVWAGYSATEGEGKFSLRTLQLTGQLSKKLRMYVKYDNSLTLDLASLVRANQEAQALSLGGAVNWNKALTTRLEFGARILPDNVTQKILGGEQVYFFGKGMLVKVGGFYGWSNKIANEWLGYGGVRIPVTSWYALEPYYFRSQVEDAPSPENRFLLNNQLRSTKGYELNLGLLYGKAGVADSIDDKIFGSYATAVLPLSQVIWGHLSVRWETTPFADLTVIAAGVKIRLEK